MPSRDKRLERLERLLSLYQRGAYTVVEVASYCVAVADSEIAAELLRPLPPEILRRIKEVADDSPTTEDGWAKLELIPIRDDPLPGTNRDECMARYRASIEALRAVVGSCGSEPGAAPDSPGHFRSDGA
jgi:hypothetical protein